MIRSLQFPLTTTSTNYVLTQKNRYIHLWLRNTTNYFNFLVGKKVLKTKNCFLSLHGLLFWVQVTYKSSLKVFNLPKWVHKKKYLCICTLNKRLEWNLLLAFFSFFSHCTLWNNEKNSGLWRSEKSLRDSIFIKNKHIW